MKILIVLSFAIISLTYLFTSLLQHIMFLTPSGRFETNTKICLSFSAYHPELWQPAWGIRLILEALISFLPTPADGAIGALDWSAKERQRLAKKSVEWCCPNCGPIKNLIPEEKPKEGMGDESETKKKSRFAKEIEQLQAMQMQQHKKEENEDEKEGAESSQKKKDPQLKSDDENIESKSPTNAKDGTGSSESSNTKDGASAKKSVSSGNEQDETAHQATEGTQPVASSTFAETEETPDSDEEEEIVFVHPQRDSKRMMEEFQKLKAAVNDNGIDIDECEAVQASDDPGSEIVEDEGPAMVTHPHQVETDYPPAVSSGVWWMMDPLLQLIIVVLSAICYILLRKVHALAEELQSLEP